MVGFTSFCVHVNILKTNNVEKMMSKQPNENMIRLAGRSRKLQKSFGFIEHRELSAEFLPGLEASEPVRPKWG